MKYEEALEALSELNKRGIHPGLEGLWMLQRLVTLPVVIPSPKPLIVLQNVQQEE